MGEATDKCPYGPYPVPIETPWYEPEETGKAEIFRVADPAGREQGYHPVVRGFVGRTARYADRARVPDLGKPPHEVALGVERLSRFIACYKGLRIHVRASARSIGCAGPVPLGKRGIGWPAAALQRMRRDHRLPYEAANARRSLAIAAGRPRTFMIRPVAS
jgi:hypothetical protein